MAMSGTPTASTAEVSVPGGLTHPQELGRGLQLQLQELQREPGSLSSTQLCFAETSSGSLGASLARGGEAVQALPSERNPGTLPPPLSRRESNRALPGAAPSLTTLVPSSVLPCPRKAMPSPFPRVGEEVCLSLSV